MTEVKEVRVMHHGQERVIRGSDKEIAASIESLKEVPKEEAKAAKKAAAEAKTDKK